jgi:hypothetical protein
MIVALDLRKCHNLDQRLLVKVTIRIMVKKLAIVCPGCNSLPSFLVKDQGHYAHNGLNIVLATSFPLKAWIGIIFHRIVTLDPRKCQDLDPRSLVKGHDHYT